MIDIDILGTLASFAWWHWVLFILLALLCFVGYVLYRGYNRMKPKPIEGIPIPPLSHPVLGHPDKMLHPLKHEMRWEVCEAARASVHQLVMMNHASIFVNDAEEAGRIIDKLPAKGAIYNAFRYDAAVPDVFACDDPDYTVRFKALSPSLLAMKCR